MKVAIVGSRKFPEAYMRVHRCVGKLKSLYGQNLVIITGGGGIVDHHAIQESIEHGVTVVVYPADWKKYGRRAGPIRNTKIAKGADVIYAFWDGESPGTADVIRKGQELNKKVIIRRVKDV